MDPLLSISTKAASVPPPPLVSPDSGKRAAASAAADAPAPKKAKTGLKKLFDNWSNALVDSSSNHRHYQQFQHYRYKVTVKDAAKWTPAEISDLFDGHGEKIQPTPWNKPKSSVTIIRFDSYAKVKDFFATVGGADIGEDYDVQLWRKPEYGAIYQYDTVESRMWQMEVHYSKRQKTLSLAFSFVLGPLLKPWGLGLHAEEDESD